MLMEVDLASLDRVVGGQSSSSERLEQPFDDRRYTRQEICSQVNDNINTWRRMATHERARGEHHLAAQSRQNAMANEEKYLRYCPAS